MDQKETNPSEEVISLPMKRRRAKKRGCILFRKKLQERRSIAIRMKRRSLECSRKQQKRNQLLVKERRGRSKSKENTKKEIFFEGDLKLNDNQKESLTRKAGQESTGRKGRGALKNVRDLWPGGLVRYHLSNNIWTQSKEVIRATLRDLQSKLGNCIRFQEIDTGNRIFVKWSPYRSWSWYGYQGNVQNLELKSREFTPGAVCDGTQNVKQLPIQILFFQYQLFSIPIPVLFLVPNFSETGSETFSGTIFFRYQFRYHQNKM